MDHISIIIVHYNSDKDTLLCLESLQKIKAPSFKFSILVVDNGSLKNFKLPRALQAEQVEIIRSEANLGFTGGNNLGMSYAREKYQADYFLLLNNDTIVDENFLNELYKASKEVEKPGLLCPKIYFEKGREFQQNSYEKKDLGKVLWYAGGSIDWLNLSAFHRGVDELDRGQFDHQKVSEFATGCCVLIPRAVLETVGRLDKNYFLYFEDVDLSVRVKQAGFSLNFVPTSVIWHKNAGGSGGAGSPTSVYYQTRNRLFFAFKHGNLKVKKTALRLWFQKLIFGTKFEQKAAFDLVLGKMGKQALA